MIPLITLEEHYLDAELMSDPLNASSPMHAMPSATLSKLSSLSRNRIESLESNGIKIQVLSHTPIHVTPVLAREANDRLSLKIKGNDKYRAFALLPVSHPDEASKELERCINQHGFKGALIDNHVQGRFYDDPFFWPIFEKAQEMDKPIYIHPTFASPQMLDSTYKGNYPSQTATMLGAFGFGWHVDTGLAILRLFHSGFFDRFPKIKIILGHMGETLPFLFDRITHQPFFQPGFKIGQAQIPAQRGFKAVWDENLWFTTSGMFSLAPFKCLLGTVKKDRIMISVDYPFSRNEQGRGFVEEIQNSGLVSEAELLDMTHRNAARLLGLEMDEAGRDKD